MVSLLVILLSLPFFFFFFLVYLIQNYRTKNGASPNPPGPKGLPLVGNLHQLDNSTLHRHLWQLSKQYGPLMLIRLGSTPTIVVSSAKMAKHFLKTHDSKFSSRPRLFGQQLLTYDGLDMVFTPNLDYWREIRKLCVLHLFNPKRVQAFGSIRKDEVLRTIQKISHSASSGKVVNMNEILMSFASSLICRVAFGNRYEYEGSESTRFHELLREAQELMATFYFSDHFPFLGWVDRLRGLVWRLQSNFKELDDFYQKIIEDHINPNRPSTEQDDFLDACLGLMKDHSFSFDLTWNHIKAVLTDIFMAGTDTNAAVLVWAMTALMKNPRVMHKVQEEIRNLNIGRSFIEEDDIQKLPYMKAVVKETLRLYPPAPLMVPREANESCEINGYHIKPKTVVYFNVWAIGRDPETWENPKEFNPDRFVSCTKDFKGQDFELIPFGAGRRICPGLNMGVASVELALCNLLFAFDWDMPLGMKTEDIDDLALPGITMLKKNALCLVAKTPSSSSSLIC